MTFVSIIGTQAAPSAELPTPEPQAQTISPPQPVKEIQMSDNQNTASAGSTGWAAAGGAAAAVLLGENGILGGGNRNGGVTQEYVSNQVNGLRETLQADATLAAIAGVGTQVNGIKGEVAGVAAGLQASITANGNATNLALCNLGHNMTQGFANLGQVVTSGFADASRQNLEQALQAERQRATELRIELGESRATAQHRETQNIVVNAQASSGGANGFGGYHHAIHGLTSAVASIQAQLAKMTP